MAAKPPHTQVEFCLYWAQASSSFIASSVKRFWFLGVVKGCGPPKCAFERGTGAATVGLGPQVPSVCYHQEERAPIPPSSRALCWVRGQTQSPRRAAAWVCRRERGSCAQS